MKIQKGDILIAKPTLANDIFTRSVVIITEHGENGSVGFILNKSSHIPLNIFVSQMNSELIVYEGGPVDKDNIYYLHSRPDLISDSEKICDNIYWSGNYNDVRNAVNNGKIGDDEIRFYLGYSGWTTDQLESELSLNAWIHIREKIDIFRDWEVDLWKNQMKKLGGEHLLWVNAPADPSMN
ncbi:YqgE/AlgH family protein [Vaginella massiliensis]|uniref:YqgE/AlgH family protein n=1 Tax=Vaginella massiliensis TaxID=1816680 RepID=UPI000838C5A4|nr:YqgE/AlgH family protein [Vaginella massiliensis]